MKIITLYFVCLVISLLFTILGAIFKIMHISYFELLFDIAIPFTLVFIVLGLKDVVSSNRFTGIEKLMWLTAFIFVSGIAGIVYYPRFRKNFLRREKPGLRY